MSMFTTRPEILGRFGVVTSTHWIASAIGMSMLERGGNAFDAAVAAGLVLQVVEPHLNGPGGDMPALVYSAARGKVDVICAQGTAPAAASIEHYRREGLDIIPGDGMLATVIPGSFDGWMLMLRDYGSLDLRTVLEPAIHYAEHGHPMLVRVSQTIEEMAEFFRTEWPTSAALWLPGGAVPVPGSNFTNRALAATWRRLLAEAEARRGREDQVEAARDAFYRGFVAEAIDGFVRSTSVMDASGNRHQGVLTGADMARWRATVEASTRYDYHGWAVHKTGAWGQGPVLLQSLALLSGVDMAGVDPNGADFVHLVTEAMKLAYADREVYYGDSLPQAVPLDVLLSEPYNAARRALIGNEASFDLRPGLVSGHEGVFERAQSLFAGMEGKHGVVFEPTMGHLAEERGDTVHIDVIDRWGNMVSATPSGGWLQSSPTIPELGFCLNSRAQMFWLTPDLPSSLAPGRRPRTTLTPTLAANADGTFLAFGTPGGDQQDQWQLSFFLRHVHHGLNLQEAIDMPLFHTSHMPASFYPRSREPGHLMIESSAPAATLDALASRGHKLELAHPWTVGRLTAARRDPDGLLHAAATPRLMQAYAIGR